MACLDGGDGCPGFPELPAGQWAAVCPTQPHRSISASIPTLGRNNGRRAPTSPWLRILLLHICLSPHFYPVSAFASPPDSMVRFRYGRSTSILPAIERISPNL